MEEVSTRVLSRRRLLAGGLAGAGTLALSACMNDPDPPDSLPGGEIFVARVKQVPVDNPRSSEWTRSPGMSVTLGPQNIALPNRANPVVPEIAVRAVHDGRLIGFLLAWGDVDESDTTVRVQDFRDACAVLIGNGDGDQAIRAMGTKDSPVVLLHWKADWQRDMDDGVQGEAQVYPNRSIDVYPPLQLDVPRDVTADDYRKANATQWLPGLHVGNPLAADTRTTCVEKLVAAGFGTATHAENQDALGRGERAGRGWRVVLAAPLAGAVGEPVLQPGRAYTCAFALWSGGTRDAGGRKSPSEQTHRLHLEA